MFRHWINIHRNIIREAHFRTFPHVTIIPISSLRARSLDRRRTRQTHTYTHTPMFQEMSLVFFLSSSFFFRGALATNATHNATRERDSKVVGPPCETIIETVHGPGVIRPKWQMPARCAWYRRGDATPVMSLQLKYVAVGPRDPGVLFIMGIHIYRHNWGRFDYPSA